MIAVYQGLITASGEIDTSGRLRAALKRSQALLEAASAGTEVARRDLIQSVVDAYYNLALATTQRRGSEINLAAAQDFENNTRLNLEAGEVAPVDLVRARLQTATRIDELEQARATETVNAETLDFLIGHTVTEPVEAVDLLTQMPADNEIERYSEATIKHSAGVCTVRGRTPGGGKGSVCRARGTEAAINLFGERRIYIGFRASRAAPRSHRRAGKHRRFDSAFRCRGEQIARGTSAAQDAAGGEFEGVGRTAVRAGLLHCQNSGDLGTGTHPKDRGEHRRCGAER